jgi:long-chain acyl-CoA synthetase
MLTHGNMVANVTNVRVDALVLRGGPRRRRDAAAALPRVRADRDADDVLQWGANHVLIANPRDLPAFIHELKKTPFTVIVGVDALYRALVDAQFQDIDSRR